MHRIARASSPGNGGISQAKPGGSGRKEARDLLVRNNKQLGVYGPHDSSPFPKLLTNTSPCKAGFAFAGELPDPPLRRLQFAVERSHPATPGAVTAPTPTERAKFTRMATCHIRITGILSSHQWMWSSGRGGGDFSSLSFSTWA